MNNLESVGQGSNGKFALLSVAELIKVPSPAWLIEGMLEENSLAVLYGPSGCGKSFTALDWALSISKGTTWHGHNVKKGAVVYVVGEGSFGIAKRVRAWMKEHLVESAERAFFTLTAPQMLNPVDVVNLAARIGQLKNPPLKKSPILIILDTLARCFVGGEENAAKDVGLFVNACQDLKQQTGAAILIVHHTGKGASDSSSKPTERGSSALRGAADVMIRQEMRREVIIVSNDKQKDEEEFKSVVLRLKQIDLGPDEKAGRPIRSAVLIPSTILGELPAAVLSADLQVALDVLASMDGIAQSNAWHTAISAKRGKTVPLRTFHNWRKKLLDMGKINPVGGKPGWYEVAPSASATTAPKSVA